MINNRNRDKLKTRILLTSNDIMSEELRQKGLHEHGLKVGNYEFYNIGSTTLNQLKKAKIIPNKDYKKYGTRKPDALLADRRNKHRIKVICVIEHKDQGKFISDADIKDAIEEGNDLCQILNAEVGIATDSSSFRWFNPNQKNKKNEYSDRTTKQKRSYSLIKDENNKNFTDKFIISQKNNEIDIAKLDAKTRTSLETLEIIRNAISSSNSQLIKQSTTDPTTLATQIWQDIWTRIFLFPFIF